MSRLAFVCRLLLHPGLLLLPAVSLTLGSLAASGLFFLVFRLL